MYLREGFAMAVTIEFGSLFDAGIESVKTFNSASVFPHLENSKGATYWYSPGSTPESADHHRGVCVGGPFDLPNRTITADDLTNMRAKVDAELEARKVRPKGEFAYELILIREHPEKAWIFVEDRYTGPLDM
jgi:hypothetical protein